jgi:hypothetical protein
MNAEVAELVSVLREAWHFTPPGSRLDAKVAKTLHHYGVPDARPRPSTDPPTPNDIIDVLEDARSRLPCHLGDSSTLRQRLGELIRYYSDWERALPGSVRGKEGKGGVL